MVRSGIGCLGIALLFALFGPGAFLLLRGFSIPFVVLVVAWWIFLLSLSAGVGSPDVYIGACAGC